MAHSLVAAEPDLAGNNLAELADTANLAYWLGEATFRKGIEHYLRCGQALLKARKLCGHGNFESWMKGNLSFSPTQARRYMKLVKKTLRADLNKADLSELDLDEARKNWHAIYNPNQVDDADPGDNSSPTASDAQGESTPTATARQTGRKEYKPSASLPNDGKIPVTVAIDETEFAAWESDIAFLERGLKARDEGTAVRWAVRFTRQYLEKGRQR